jgi:drug/metabolite transporter (DMT)-like permease
MEPSQQRLLGIMLVLASAALFALAGVFTKLVQADVWTITGWRGLVGAIITAGYFFWRRHTEGRPISVRMGRNGWLFAALSAATQLLYIGALKFTYVANVAVIYAIAPFIAAGLAWLFVGERVRPLTLLTATISMCGVLIIVANGLGSGSSFGDGLAVAMTISFAVYMVAVRAFQDTPVLWAVAVSSFLLAMFSLFVSDPLSVGWRDFGYLILFGLTFSSGVILFTEGARLLPVSETALIGTMDVPFAAGFAWLFLAEAAPSATIIGGLVVVGALVLQALGDIAGAHWQGWRTFRGRSTPTPPPSRSGGDR